MLIGTVPDGCEGLVASSSPSDTIWNELAGCEPNFTAATRDRPVPLMTATVPPAVGPDAGVTLLTETT